jgi:hypothetical protein
VPLAAEALPLLGAASAVAYQLGRALVAWVQGKMRVAEIEAAGKVLIDLARLDPDQAERLGARLDRARPPPPSGEVEPPA